MSEDQKPKIPERPKPNTTKIKTGGGVNGVTTAIVLIALVLLAYAVLNLPSMAGC